MAAAAVILLALPNCRRRLWLNVPECLERLLSECEVAQSAYSAGSARSNPQILRFAAGTRSRFRELCDGIDRRRFRHPSAHEGDVREAGDEEPNEPCVIEEWA